MLNTSQECIMMMFEILSPG